MITLGGIVYSIDFDALDKVITINKDDKGDEVIETETTTIKNMKGEVESIEEIIKKYPTSREIDMIRYDTLGLLLQVIMSNEEIIDDALGAERALEGMPLNYKIAFNTLTEYGILKAVE